MWGAPTITTYKTGYTMQKNTISDVSKTSRITPWVQHAPVICTMQRKGCSKRRAMRARAKIAPELPQAYFCAHFCCFGLKCMASVPLKPVLRFSHTPNVETMGGQVDLCRRWNRSTQTLLVDQGRWVDALRA